MSPKGEQPERPTTYGNVLTGPAAQVVATLVALGIVLGVGYKLHDVIGAASAATLDQSAAAQIQADVASIKSDLGKLSTDMIKVKCRWNIDNTCPENASSPVRSAGFTGR